MKQVDSKKLAALIRAAAAALPANPFIPIMEYVKVGDWKVTAIGPELAISIDCDITGAPVLLHHATISKVIGGVSHPVDINPGELKWKGGAMKFPPAEANDYPSLERSETSQVAKVSGNWLNETIKLLLPTTDDSIGMSPHRCVWFDFDSGFAVGGGTHSSVIKDILKGTGQIGIPKHLAGKIGQLLATSEEVFIYSGERVTVFTGTGIQVVMTNAEATMPPWGTIIDRITAAPYKDLGCDMGAVLTAAKAISSAYGGVVLKIESDGTSGKVSYSDLNGGNGFEQEVEIKVPCSFFTPATTLVHQLHISDTMWYDGPQKAIVFRSEGILGTLMPYNY